MVQAERLKELYMQSSKHSNYQILPTALEKLLHPEEIQTVSRYEKERWDYICLKLQFFSKRILDIGGNTGFFTFEALEAGAEHVDYYEGNPAHANFVTLALEALEWEERVKVFPEYYLFRQNEKLYDIVFCMNVIHHLGEDFSARKDMQNAKNEMISCVNRLAYITDIMVFQMGFNWCGKRDACLFENGTKAEMENFLKEGTEEYWEFGEIGIAEKENGSIRYRDMDKQNNIRMDFLGEFLNRPIFIMKSKIY